MDTHTVTTLEDGRTKVQCNVCKHAITLQVHGPSAHFCKAQEGKRIVYWPEGFDARKFDEAKAKKPARPRPDPSQQGPTLLEKASNFNQARKQHNKAGKPKATDEQVAERFAICVSNQCGFYKGDDKTGTCTHKKCGCGLHSVGNESMIKPNKLRWADQKCPIGLWLPVIPKPTGE